MEPPSTLFAPAYSIFNVEEIKVSEFSSYACKYNQCIQIKTFQNIMYFSYTYSPFLQLVQLAPYNIVPHRHPSAASSDTEDLYAHLYWVLYQIFGSLLLLFLPLLMPWLFWFILGEIRDPSNFYPTRTANRAAGERPAKRKACRINTSKSFFVVLMGTMTAT